MSLVCVLRLAGRPGKTLGSGRSGTLTEYMFPLASIYLGFMENAGPGLFSAEGLFTGSTLSNKRNLKRITVKVCM